MLIEVQKRYNCVCLTNNFPNEFQDHKENKFNQIKSNFEIIFESSKLKCRKPEKEIYQIVLNTLNVKPDELLFIDDLGINLKPAREFGIVTYKFINTKDAINFLDKEL